MGKAHLQAPGGGGSGVAEGFLRQKVAGSGQQLGKLPQERGHGKASLRGDTAGGPGSAWGRFLRRRCAAVESSLAARAVGSTGPRVERRLGKREPAGWACSWLSLSPTAHRLCDLEDRARPLCVSFRSVSWERVLHGCCLEAHGCVVTAGLGFRKAPQAAGQPSAWSSVFPNN